MSCLSVSPTVLDGSRLCRRLSSEIISLSFLKVFHIVMEEKLVNDFSLHSNGNHLVVVFALCSDQKSLLRDFASKEILS